MNVNFNGNILIFIFLFFLVSLLFAIILIRLFKIKGRRIYKQKGPYLLSQGETKFFEALSKVISSNDYICPKVRIADLVDVDIPKTDKYFWNSFNKISQKHVDFVICNKLNFAPKLVIELDGGSHEMKASAERDVFVDRVFKDAGIPIIHIKVSGFYNFAEIRSLINTNLKN